MLTFDEDGVWEWWEEEKRLLSVSLFINNEIETNNHTGEQSSPLVSEESSGVFLEASSPSILRRSQRDCRPPAYLKDYKISDDSDDDEDVVHYAFFADYDLIVFEEASNDDWWIKTMDEEIFATKKNNTWELTVLSKKKKPIGVK